MKPLDVVNCPLSGVNLIEASAGTGKTWTIAALFARLLLEDGEMPAPSIDRILVVTYTKAATAELRERLRARLVEIRRVLESEADTHSEPFLAALCVRYGAPEARSRAVARLAAAISGFDAAAIYTIHGFCQRVLTDAAFESAQTFEAELVVDDMAGLTELTDDFWRRRVVEDVTLSRVLAENGETPDAWLSAVRPHLSRPYLTPLRPPEIDLAAVLAAQDVAWQALKSGDVAAGLALFTSTEGYKATSYKPAIVAHIARLLTRLLASEQAPALLSEGELKNLAKLTPASLAAGMKKGFVAPKHALFSQVEAWLLCAQALRQGVDYAVIRLKLELIDWINAEHERVRAHKRKRSFDDLLTDLYGALNEKTSGPLLAQHVARSFQVALIDEFQDTDPIQYDIFRRCFIEAGSRPPVFLVGDPKQAIYSFRGADIFAYLAARGDADHEYTLDTNRRSCEPLVQAVNTLFARPQPFVLDAITYYPVSADSQQRGRLEIDDDRAPFTVLWQDNDADKAASKDKAGQWAADACANEIARLLNLSGEGRARLYKGEAGRALSGGDMAVLVATHRQGEMMRQALRSRGVASVALTQESVFASMEAREMLALLRAWAEPGSEGRLRAALASSLYGLDAAALFALAEDEDAWEACLRLNREDFERWQAQGFMAAWRGFFARSELALRVLPQEGGERRLTNLAHLAELIQQQSEEKSGLSPLLAWFEGRVATPPGGEEAVLRLESDAQLVKIVTIHTAKGLQYPLVFCPFLWDGKLDAADTPFWRYHHDGQTLLVPDGLAGDEAKAASREEILGEKLRLLYVALTRAQYRQVLCWRHVSGMESAALSWLIHAAAVESPGELSRLKLDELGIKDDLAELCLRGGEAFSVLPAATLRTDCIAAPQAAEPPELSVLARTLYTPWRVSSFTALTSKTPARLAEKPDHDQGVLAETTAQAGELAQFNRFNFPRGARPGTCLHAVFEAIDFQWSETRIRDAAAQTLARFGFAEHWLDAVCDIVARTLDAPLDEGVSLRRVPATRRLVEFNFTRPLARLSVARLRRVLGDPALGLAEPLRAAAATLDFHTVEGFITGSIDLACQVDGRWFLIDYKSNHLGDQGSDYAPERLVHEIAHAHYYLQYLIYVAALKRYLASRGMMLDGNFAGVRYLFVRGLDDGGNGIWRDSPSPALIAALDGCFDGD
ncbi:exodeoxyribonuclease V subunit beta [Craterilacuibacter sp.]|uniref:exodeoxyribonuclease V subunit beta n=1 Tax=Craterilacuibacter sp. TaxID=2870909 RepID=UPI003F3BCA44